MFALDQLGRANSVCVAFRRLFHHMELSRHQQSAVMFRENLPLNDSAIARIAVSPWRVILRAFYLRPIQRRVRQDDSDRTRTKMPLIDLAHRFVELPVNRRIPGQRHRSFSPQALQLALTQLLAGREFVRQSLEPRVSEFDDDIIRPADELRVANHLSEESVQLLPPMQFPDHDKRMLIELLRDLGNDRCG